MFYNKSQYCLSKVKIKLNVNKEIWLSIICNCVCNGGVN